MKSTLKTKPTLKKIFAFLSLCTQLACSYIPIGNDIPDEINVKEGKDYILYEPQSGAVSTTGLIFYPGGLIEPHAYDVILGTFAAQGYKVILAKMPLNLAVFNSNAAFNLIERYPEIDQWVIAGHSLGGAMACKAINERPEVFSGLVLLAAYPDDQDDISDWNGAVLSISGSEDLITTPDEIQNSKPFLPSGFEIMDPSEILNTDLSGTTVFYEIQGANHAQFGNYGSQNDDGTAAISGEEQIFQTKEILEAFWETNNW